MPSRGIFFEREPIVGWRPPAEPTLTSARELHLSVNAIETHMEHIYAKLATHSGRELIVASPSLDQNA